MHSPITDPPPCDVCLSPAHGTGAHKALEAAWSGQMGTPVEIRAVEVWVPTGHGTRGNYCRAAIYETDDGSLHIEVAGLSKERRADFLTSNWSVRISSTR